MNKKQKMFISVGTVVVLFVALVHFTLAAFTTSPFNISKASTDAGFPAIAVSTNGQNIGIAWAEKRSGGTAIRGPIYLKTASNGSVLNQWLTVDNANSTTDQSFSPDVAADPNTQTNMHVVWANISGGGSAGDQFYTIYYAVCSTTGSSCTEGSPPVKQVNTTTTGKTLQDPKVATSDHGSNTAVHVVWVEVDRQAAPNTVTVYYSGKRADNGTWTTPEILSVATGVGSEFAFHPAIATSEDSGGTKYVHVVWASDNDKDTGSGDDTEDIEEIKYRRGTLNAITGVPSWSPSPKSFIKKPDSTPSTNPNYPAVAAVENIVMVLWDDLTQTPWPNDEQYLGVNDVSVDAGATFPSVDGADPPGQIGSSAFRSDHDTSVNTADVRGSDHARRLQIKATANLTSTADITAVVDVVFHATNSTGSPNRHDVRYNRYLVGNDSCGTCGDWTEDPTVNETENKKLSGSPAKSYSMSPAIAAINQGTQLYAVYMEGKEEGGWDVNDAFVFDIIYKGTVTLTDSTSRSAVYLPVILKNSSG